MKTCTRCGETKARDLFSRDARRPDGLRSDCKACDNERQRLYREANAAKLAERQRAYREANAAKIAERMRAYREANAAKLAERQRAYREANAAKIAERDRAYYEANAAKIAEYQRAYREANAAKVAERQRLYCEANAAKIAERMRAYREANAAKLAERQRAYREANPHLVNAQIARRRAVKLQRTVAWSDAVAIATLYEIAARVSRCTGVEHHVDHVVPLQGRKVSGLHVPLNLRVVPATLNLRKNNRFEVGA